MRTIMNYFQMTCWKTGSFLIFLLVTTSILVFIFKPTSVSFLPVDAAAAPIRMEGIPHRGKITAAAKHVILAVVTEEADKVLWWKHWFARFPSAFNMKQLTVYRLAPCLNSTILNHWWGSEFSQRAAEVYAQPAGDIILTTAWPLHWKDDPEGLQIRSKWM